MRSAHQRIRTSITCTAPAPTHTRFVTTRHPAQEPTQVYAGSQHKSTQGNAAAMQSIAPAPQNQVRPLASYRKLGALLYSQLPEQESSWPILCHVIHTSMPLPTLLYTCLDSRELLLMLLRHIRLVIRKRTLAVHARGFAPPSTSPTLCSTSRKLTHSLGHVRRQW